MKRSGETSSLLRVVSQPFYGLPPALLTKPRLRSWARSWVFLTHSMSYSPLTGGRERAGWTAGELLRASCTQQVAGALSMQPGHLKNEKLGQTGTLSGMAIVTSHLGSYLLIKSFYYDVKHPAKMTEHLVFSSWIKISCKLCLCHTY